jgi:hypothetical protein
MSVSGFHHHFKQVTAMSPLEFQKQLRLQEARRLMLDEGFDASSSGYRVGYNDVSHFSPRVQAAVRRAAAARRGAAAGSRSAKCRLLSRFGTISVGGMIAVRRELRAIHLIGGSVWGSDPTQLLDRTPGTR